MPEMTDGHTGTNGAHGTSGANGTGCVRPYGRMTLMEAAFLVERLQGRAAHAGEVEALRIARDALLTIVAEGYCTLGERLRPPMNGTRAG
jgi:hypothetical protein